MTSAHIPVQLCHSLLHRRQGDLSVNGTFIHTQVKSQNTSILNRLPASNPNLKNCSINPPDGSAYCRSFRVTKAVHCIEHMVEIVVYTVEIDPAEWHMKIFVKPELFP